MGKIYRKDGTVTIEASPSMTDAKKETGSLDKSSAQATALLCRALVSDDAVAIPCQTIEQYRAALIAKLDGFIHDCTVPHDAGIKEQMKTEQELRATDVPSLDDSGELKAYIDRLTGRDHDYGTCVYAMSMAATAAFNHVAKKLGVTGFQAGCADMDFLRRSRGYKGPFMVLDGDNLCYPQYDLHAKLSEAIEEWMPWVAEQAKKRLIDSPDACKEVIAHWQRLAGPKPASALFSHEVTP